MISNYNEKEYLQARRRQERIADKIDAVGNATKNEIQSFMKREERLQAYELIHDWTDEDVFLRIEIAEVLLFKICVKARRARITIDAFIEKELTKALDGYENTVRQ